MKLDHLHIWVLVAVAAIAWWTVLLIQGTPVTEAHGEPFTIVVGVLVLFGLGLEHIFWRAPFLNGWFIKRPNLRGTWRIELQSSYIDPKTQERTPIILCYMGIEQTLSNLQMHLMTPDSESWVIADRIHPSPSGMGYQVMGIYRNEPSVHLREQGNSEIHHGAFMLDTHGFNSRPNTLTSKYWTDRKTTGTMKFTDRVEQVCTCFEDAGKAFQLKEGLQES